MRKSTTVAETGRKSRKPTSIKGGWIARRWFLMTWNDLVSKRRGWQYVYTIQPSHHKPAWSCSWIQPLWFLVTIGAEIQKIHKWLRLHSATPPHGWQLWLLHSYLQTSATVSQHPFPSADCHLHICGKHGKASVSTWFAGVRCAWDFSIKDQLGCVYSVGLSFPAGDEKWEVAWSFFDLWFCHAV